jgi:FAD/FMN-containing dehydrogenase
VCPSVQREWETIFFHVDNPISSAWNNFNNDSCLPIASDPCSGEGYPVYVVNATESAHVQAAVKFAGMHNVRLNVKGTGHDYLGRQDNLKSIYNIY